MDFKISSEHMDSTIESYENIAKRIDENKEKIKKAINELTDDSWKGLRAKSSKAQFILWTSQCDEITKHINDFKDILKDKETKINNLLTQGKNLKI